MAAISLVLFDLDGVLVHYDRGRRMEALGAALGRDPGRIFDVLFGEGGLEHRYDAGLLRGDAYLDALSSALGCEVDAATWRDARRAAMECTAATCERIAMFAAGAIEVAILTNNGPMIADALPAELAARFPHGRILCSGGLGIAKPAPIAYLRAVERLGHAPGSTLFLDDSPGNVEGARAAGLHAEHVPMPGAFAAILARYGLD